MPSPEQLQVVWMPLIQAQFPLGWPNSVETRLPACSEAQVYTYRHVARYHWPCVFHVDGSLSTSLYACASDDSKPGFSPETLRHCHRLALNQCSQTPVLLYSEVQGGQVFHCVLIQSLTWYIAYQAAAVIPLCVKTVVETAVLFHTRSNYSTFSTCRRSACSCM